MTADVDAAGDMCAAGTLRPCVSYWLTRFVLLRLMGLVYFTAFLVAANQLVPLVGHDGLLPADRFMEQVRGHYGSFWNAFWKTPDATFYGGQFPLSVFWWSTSDAMIRAVSWTGVLVSAVVLAGYANALMLLLLWLLYMSVGGIGQIWYGYGWDIQILETGMLAVFLCPLLDGRPFSRSRPPVVVLWLFRWLIFRIMMGAFLIKWRGDECWRDYTALYYHYETQPVPNPLSPLLHRAPHWFNKFGVGVNHFVEFIVPWFCFWPRHARNVAGILMAGFQMTLICTGNLSFLNWLTIIPCIACIDDSVWRRLLPGALVRFAEQAQVEGKVPLAPQVASWAYAVLVAVLSWWPVKNLLSPHQVMNGSFDKLHLVGSYGAFGSVGKERFELIFEGTLDEHPTEKSEWREYEFKVKPGDPKRRPPVITPYHYRLDWQIWYQWFQGLPPPGPSAWPVHFIWKLLHNDAGTLGLLAGNPFPDAPPKFIRVLLYRYNFAPPGNADGAWWVRERVVEWLPPFSTESVPLREFLIANGFIKPGQR